VEVRTVGRKSRMGYTEEDVGFIGVRVGTTGLGGGKWTGGGGVAWVLYGFGINRMCGGGRVKNDVIRGCALDERRRRVMGIGAYGHPPPDDFCWVFASNPPAWIRVQLPDCSRLAGHASR
jgi:hypothetical protein